MWRVIYGMPDRRLHLYGITGTNGKTTTALVLGSIFSAAYGREYVGLLSTAVFWVGNETIENTTHMTSTNARMVYRYLRRMADTGVRHVVLELTSHALDQHRLAGLHLAGGIILNISHEHLDYHQTMEAYARAKERIVEYLVPHGVLVGNRDDVLVRQILDRAHGVTVIGFTVAQARSVVTPLPGDFNRENVLAASLLAEAVGVPGDALQRGVGAVAHVPGRVEWLDAPRGFRVLIDFAVTPDALERLYRYVRQEVSGRIIAVFGGTGRRDRTKRPLMAQAVARFADEIVLTQDEPYDEPEEQIYAELEAGLDRECEVGPAFAKASPYAKATDDASAGTRHSDTAARCTVVWQRIEDRRDALAYALSQARSGDAVVVTGMGSFTTRMVGGREISWNDKRVVLELLGSGGRF